MYGNKKIWRKKAQEYKRDTMVDKMVERNLIAKLEAKWKE